MGALERFLVCLFLLNVNSFQGQSDTFPPGVRLAGCFRNRKHGLEMGPLTLNCDVHSKPAECVKCCVANKMLYAGKERWLCRCGNTYGRLRKEKSMVWCFATCGARGRGLCGGLYSSTIYSLHHYYKDKLCIEIPEAFRGSWFASTEPERQVVIFTNAILWRPTNTQGTFSAYVEVKQIYCINTAVTRVVGSLHGPSNKKHVCITLKAGTDATLNVTVTRTDKGGPNECDIPESTAKGLYEEFALTEKPLPKVIGFKSLGCFSDHRLVRPTMYDSLFSQQRMKRPVCGRYCYARQSYYFSIRETHWCDCGFVIPEKAKKECSAGCGLKPSNCSKWDNLSMFKFDKVQKASAPMIEKLEGGVYAETHPYIGNATMYFTTNKKTGTKMAIVESCVMACGFDNRTYALISDKSDNVLCYCRNTISKEESRKAKSWDLEKTTRHKKRGKKKVATYEFSMYKSEFRRPVCRRKTKPLSAAPSASVLIKVLSNKKLATDLINNVSSMSGKGKESLGKTGSKVNQGGKMPRPTVEIATVKTPKHGNKIPSHGSPNTGPQKPKGGLQKPEHGPPKAGPLNPYSGVQNSENSENILGPPTETMDRPKVKIESQHVDVVDRLPGNSSDGSIARLKQIKGQVEGATGGSPMVMIGAGGLVVIVIIIICCKKKKSEPELPADEQSLLDSDESEEASHVLDSDESEEASHDKKKRTSHKKTKKKKKKKREYDD